VTAKPGLGSESNEHRPICLYSGPARDIHNPCTEPAVTHLLVDSTTHGRVMIAACPTHLWTARGTGDVVLEHPFRGCCGMPGTRWLDEPLNVCVLDDSGEELAGHAGRNIHEPVLASSGLPA
jgi:hypothetical protein